MLRAAVPSRSDDLFIVGDTHQRTPPILHGARTRSAEMDHLVSVVRSWLDDGVQPAQAGIAARSSALVDEAVAALAGSGIPAVSLGKRAAKTVRWRS